MVSVLEFLAYAVVFVILRMVYFQLSDGGRNRGPGYLVIGAGIVILGVILSGIDLAGLAENWRDLAANGLIAAAVISVVLGYARLIGIARRNAGRDKDRD
ncbi:MAG: hypothetical protein AAF415_08070 [Pseudomonadota bacterium]